MERTRPVTYYQLEDNVSEVTTLQEDLDQMEDSCSAVDPDINSCAADVTSEGDDDDVSDTDLQVVSSTTTPTMTGSLSSNCSLGRTVPWRVRCRIRCVCCCQRWGKTLRSRPCTICLLIFLALLSLTCALALVSVVLLMAVPYHRSSTFLHTLCRVETARVQPEPARCTCGTGCTVDFPCLHIVVSYTAAVSDTNNINTTFNSELFENEAVLHKQCTYFPSCQSSRSANSRSVKLYEERYAQPGHTFKCLYSPLHPSDVIRTRRFRLHHVIHALLWTCILFISSVVLLVLAIKRHGCGFL